MHDSCSASLILFLALPSLLWLAIQKRVRRPGIIYYVNDEEGREEV